MADQNHVNLNVGGTHFRTSLSTFEKLSKMVSGKMRLEKDKDGVVFIDRDAKHFNRILNFIRDGLIPIPETRAEREELQMEAQFYGMQSLISALCRIR